MIQAGILSVRFACLRQRKVELLEGDILEMSPEGPLHTDYGEGLANYLRNRLINQAWIREARPITLSHSEPDIAVVQLPRSRYREHHPYPEKIFY